MEGDWGVIAEILGVIERISQPICLHCFKRVGYHGKGQACEQNAKKIKLGLYRD